MGSDRRKTMAEIARTAGISPATVSRVFHGSPNVSRRTRQVVAGTLRQFGYQPIDPYSTHAFHQRRLIGLVLSDIANPVHADIAAAVVEKARALGYSVVLCNTDNMRHLEIEYIESLRAQAVDGIVLATATLDDTAVEELVTSGYPCILLNRRLRSGRGHYVGMDHARAALEITRHLISLRHRRIGFITGPQDISSATERLEGYRLALQEADLPYEPRLVHHGEFRPRETLPATALLLKNPDPPSAIIATGDQMALAVIQSATELGLQIPRDLAVAGFDDIDVAGHPHIALTTVAQPKGLLGQLATLLLVEVIQHPEKFVENPIQKLIAPTLIIRRTCGARAAYFSNSGSAEALAPAACR